jgi:hypothetical protein
MTAPQYINTFNSKEEMFDWLKKNLSLVGRYGMCFDQGEGVSTEGASEPKARFEVHQRHSQPCIGGNLRKYGDTGHKDVLPEVRAKDYSPGDLSNKLKQSNHQWRYPDTGNPCGVGYPWTFSPHITEYIEYVFSDESPWRKGFNSAEHVELVRDKDKKIITGFIVKTGDIDPTVWVNLLKFLQGTSTSYELWKKSLDKGFTKKEAITLCAFFPSEHGLEHGRGIYVWDPASSVSRVLNSDPVDITGGLWSARYDYNRPNMACPFRPVDKEEKKNSIVFPKEISKRMKEGKDFFDASLSILK